MARRITQEMFDSVVQENIEEFEMTPDEAVVEAVQQFQAQENIEEFEMTPDEAVVEAVQQFQAQGVNLDTIVKEARSNQGTTGAENTSSKHRVVDAVDSLKHCTLSHASSVEATASSSTDSTSIPDALTKLKSCCDSSLAERCLAAESGAYPLLLIVLTNAITRLDWTLVTVDLECLASLMNGHPDILDDVGTNTLLELLGNSEPEVPIELVLRVVRYGCLKHEENRQRFVAGGLITLISSVLTSSTRRRDRKTVRQACAVYGTLTLDDDVRVPFGKGHEHARLIVGEADAIAVILTLTADYPDDVEVLGELFSTVGHLAVRDEFCQQVLKLGGLKNIIAALQVNIANQSFVRSVLGVLKALCGSDPVKVEVIQCGGADIVIECINTHARSAAVSEIGCATIAALVLRHPANCAAVMKGQAAECIVRCLQLHASSSNVQKQASMAIRNLVSRCPEHCAPFLELGVEPLLRSAMVAHSGECHDEARAALRDLECTIELKELWTGTGRDLIHD